MEGCQESLQCNIVSAAKIILALRI